MLLLKVLLALWHRGTVRRLTRYWLGWLGLAWLGLAWLGLDTAAYAVQDLGPEEAMVMAKLACKHGNPKLVVGIDLAGNEHTHPPEMFVAAFNYAHERSMGITVHAGEGQTEQSQVYLPRCSPPHSHLTHPYTRFKSGARSAKASCAPFVSLRQANNQHTRGAVGAHARV